MHLETCCYGGQPPVLGGFEPQTTPTNKDRLQSLDRNHMCGVYDRENNLPTVLYKLCSYLRRHI